MLFILWILPVRAGWMLLMLPSVHFIVFCALLLRRWWSALESRVHLSCFKPSKMQMCLDQDNSLSSIYCQWHKQKLFVLLQWVPQDGAGHSLPLLVACHWQKTEPIHLISPFCGKKWVKINCAYNTAPTLNNFSFPHLFLCSSCCILSYYKGCLHPQKVTLLVIKDVIFFCAHISI